MPTRRRMPLGRLLSCPALLVVTATALGGQTPKGPPSQAYTWKNVQIVGGGFVSGLIFHPTAAGVRYARTDMGGAYRWDERIRRWQPILDWVPYRDTNLMGVESIALDPADPNRVYLAVGTYTNPRVGNGAVLRSADRGATFQRTDMPFKMGGNENGRGNGERMAVDPNDGRILYLGTRFAGLWRSTDRGVTWSRVQSFPDVSEAPPGGGSGIVFVVFDPSSGSAGQASRTIYAGVSLMGRENLFRSTDGGATWSAVPGQPTSYRPNHGVWAADGKLYISYGTDPGPRRMVNGGVWKLDTRSGTWTDITPERPDQSRAFGYVSVAVDARRPERLIASSFGRPGGEELFRSTDGGATWQPIFAGGGTYDFSAAPYVAYTPIHWLFDIEIDPLDPDHAMFTTGYGGYETFDLTAADAGKPTKWSVMSAGIDETVPLDMVSPNEGAHLITGIGDYGGFVHRDLDRALPGAYFLNPRFGNTNSIAVAEKAPAVIVRVGRPASRSESSSIGYSLDGGRSWQPAQTPTPGSLLGRISVSADGATWIWAPERASSTYLTRDRGATWTVVRGLPPQPGIAADRVDPRRFYGLDLFGGKLYVSDDAGASFRARPLELPVRVPSPGDRWNRGDTRGGQDRLYATPGRKGDLWLAAFDGLYHSTNQGATFGKADAVEELHAFGFGKGAGSGYPSLFLVGTVRGVRGIFRSDNAARSWVRINDDQHQWGLVLLITGDPRIHGRAYVGTHGRGAFYGDPVAPAK